MSTPSQRLQDLGLTLPTPPKPVAAYVPSVQVGNLIFVSGQLPLVNGELSAVGRVPSQVTVEKAAMAARQCVLNGLAVVADQINGDLSRIRRIVRVGVFVACDIDFPDQPKVANGASQLLEEIFGEAGRHARAAVGCPALPLHAPVEVELVVEVA